MKKNENGKMGEAYKGQEKAPGSSKSKIGGIESGSSSGPKNMHVKDYGAYAAQDHAPKGLHGGPAETKGSIMKDMHIDKYGGAYEKQAHAGKDHGSPEIEDSTECLKGEPGSYLGHFRQEKFIKQGHNSDGSIPMGPSMDIMDKLKGATSGRMSDSEFENYVDRGGGVKSKDIGDDQEKLDLRSGRVSPAKMKKNDD